MDIALNNKSTTFLKKRVFSTIYNINLQPIPNKMEDKFDEITEKIYEEINPYLGRHDFGSLSLKGPEGEKF